MPQTLDHVKEHSTGLSHHSILLEKIKNKTATIGVVGLGYVGLPLTMRYCEVGYKVIGFDIDPQKISQLNQGKSYIGHISNNQIAKLRQQFHATTHFSEATTADALILCVPTPLNKWREPDLSYVESTIRSLAPYLRRGQIISLESTTYPGNTEEMLKPIIESQGLTVGKDIFLVYSPEREDPGNKNFTTSSTPKICGGTTPSCLEVGVALYEQIVSQVVPVSSTKAAEMTKLLENIHRAVNIGLVNELKIVADKMGIDIYEVIRAASTKPFGFVPYYPGPGLGGHCIPIDPFYLTWKAREYGIHTRFIELAGEVNSMMPSWVVQKIMTALNQRSKPLMNSKILILGVAYKKNIDDVRESPSFVIIEELLSKGALVHYSDPHVPTLPNTRHHHIHLDSVPLTPQMLTEYDCIVIATAHDKFDFKMIKDHASLIVDTRGIYQNNPDSNVVNA